MRLPGATPVISRPWNMDPLGGAAVCVTDCDGRPVLHYAADDGKEAELVARPVPLADYNPGDEVLVPVPRRDAEGHPLYELAEVCV